MIIQNKFCFTFFCLSQQLASRVSMHGSHCFSLRSGATAFYAPYNARGACGARAAARHVCMSSGRVGRVGHGGRTTTLQHRCLVVASNSNSEHHGTSRGTTSFGVNNAVPLGPDHVGRMTRITRITTNTRITRAAPPPVLTPHPDEVCYVLRAEKNGKRCYYSVLFPQKERRSVIAYDTRSSAHKAAEHLGLPMTCVKGVQSNALKHACKTAGVDVRLVRMYAPPVSSTTYITEE